MQNHGAIDTFNAIALCICYQYRNQDTLLNSRSPLISDTKNNTISYSKIEYHHKWSLKHSTKFVNSYYPPIHIPNSKFIIQFTFIGLISFELNQKHFTDNFMMQCSNFDCIFLIHLIMPNFVRSQTNYSCQLLFLFLLFWKNLMYQYGVK